MSARRVGMFFVGVAAALAAGCGGSASQLGPGDEIGNMTLAIGATSDADVDIWNNCDPVIREPGEHMRSCDVPFSFERLFVGWGPVALTREAIEQVWSETTYDLWIDDKRVDLQAFGSSDRPLANFPGAGGKDAILREWSVILEDVTPGEHTLRYRIRPASDAPTDATWTFTVPKA